MNNLPSKSFIAYISSISSLALPLSLYTLCLLSCSILFPTLSNSSSYCKFFNPFSAKVLFSRSYRTVSSRELKINGEFLTHVNWLKKSSMLFVLSKPSPIIVFIPRRFNIVSCIGLGSVKKI